MNLSSIEYYLRQIEILARLKNKEIFSKADLAFEYAVKEITINRDLKALRSIGFQVFSKKGKIILAEEPPTETLIPLASNFIAIKNSINHPPNAILELSKLNKKSFFEHLILLAKAVDESKVIEMTYKRFYDNKINNYTIKPIELIQNGFNWTLNGIKINENKIKTFYLSRIKSLKLLKKTFTKSETIVPEENTYEIVLKFNNDVRDDIYDKIWFDKFELKEDQTGFITLTTNQPISNKLAGWCISWWDTIKIEKPQELKDYISEMIEDFKKNNP